MLFLRSIKQLQLLSTVSVQHQTAAGAQQAGDAVRQVAGTIRPAERHLPGLLRRPAAAQADDGATQERGADQAALHSHVQRAAQRRQDRISGGSLQRHVCTVRARWVLY